MGSCSKSCGQGQRTRVRTVIQHANHGGYQCPRVYEARTCHEAPCPAACKVGKWNKWSTCSKTCGGGTHSRTRTVLELAKHGGKCVPLYMTEGCSARPCPVDCISGKRTGWNRCSRVCGGGVQNE